MERHLWSAIDTIDKESKRWKNDRDIIKMKLVVPSLEFFQIYECFQYSRDGASSPFYAISIFVALFAFLINVFHLRYQRWRQQSLLCYFYLCHIICFPCQCVSFAIPEMALVVPFILFLSFFHYLLSLFLSLFTRYKYMRLKLILICD